MRKVILHAVEKAIVFVLAFLIASWFITNHITYIWG